jgi:hypothetical protein
MISGGFFQLGQTRAEFQVNGAQAAIDAAFAGCPLSTH